MATRPRRSRSSLREIPLVEDRFDDIDHRVLTSSSRPWYPKGRIESAAGCGLSPRRNGFGRYVPRSQRPQDIRRIRPLRSGEIFGAFAIRLPCILLPITRGRAVGKVQLTYTCQSKGNAFSHLALQRSESALNIRSVQHRTHDSRIKIFNYYCFSSRSPARLALGAEFRRNACYRM